MKETDYDSSATPSLAQEMNLARRACWCNKNSKEYCRKCCSATATTTTTTTTINANDNLANNGDDDHVYDEHDDDEETVLIGATFSKNILIDNKNNVYIEPSYLKTTTTTTKDKLKTATNNIRKIYSNNNNNNNKNIINDNLIKRHSTTENIKAATKTTTTTIPKFKLNNYNNNNKMCDANDDNVTKVTKGDADYDNDDADGGDGDGNSFLPEVSMLLTETPSTSTEPHNNEETVSTSSVGQQLLHFWLAFVKFCDAVTIKSDDPVFQKARQQEHDGANVFPSGSSASTSSGGGKFRFLTSKKFIFLFLVCLFFSCINRIEARPNMSTPSNAIASNDDGSITTNAVTVPTNPSTGYASSTLPFDKKEGRPQPLLDEPFSAQAHKDENSHDPGAEAINHSHDRYPLSQVDFDRVKTPFIIGIWILSASIAKIGFHMTPKLHLIFPESCLLIVVGVIIGVVLYFCTEVAVSPLTPNTFFFYMLPPIILDAGYFMPNRMFFDNLGTILLMAVVGTIFNVATIGGSLYACGLTGMFGGPENTPKLLDTFLFASLISAVDPVAVLAVFEEIHVNEILYIVVFGESLLNDAVTVVMYHMMEVYNEIGISNILAQDIASGVGSFFVVALGGTVIGIIWGFLTGLVTRFTDHVRVIEPIFIFVMAYLAYLNAEIFHMSGILAITFCGITMKNYVESNISIKSHTTVKYALKMLSSSSETIIFMFLGVATVNNNHVWNTAYVVLTILFCSVFRVIGVILLTALANRFRLHKLSRVDQFVMSYGGLRGAVAFALVLLVDDRVVKQKDMFVTTTIAVIYFTVFLQGITIKPLVKFLNVKRANKRKPTMNERIHERFMDHLMAGIEDIVGKTGNYNVRDKFKRFDNRFIRPLLIRDLKGAEPKIIETYSKLTMRDAMEVMRRNPSTIGQITGTESMSALFRNYTNNCIGGSPSLTNLDNNISRNLDMHELDYNPSKKDLTDAKIHHLLAEELKPYRRHRRLSYSRHAVDDRDLSTQVNYKLQMNFRRMFNDRKHHKRSKRGANKQQTDGVKQNHVSFHDFQQNGTTKQFTHDEIPSKLTEVTVIGAGDDWDDGLTFTAKSTLADNPIQEEDRNISRDSDGERRVATPTATESQLPWKRHEDENSDAVQQNEFPAWASNKEYLAYNSPSATFLGGINKPKAPKSVIGLFRRESSGSKTGAAGGIIPPPGAESLGGDVFSARGSDPTLAAALASMILPSSTASTPNTSRLEKRSASIAGPVSTTLGQLGHGGPFPVTASHRRNVRRGSMLELTGDIIPEEAYHHGQSKSLCEPTSDEWGSVLPLTSARASSNARIGAPSSSSGREPLLPKLTPRTQIRKMGAGSGKSQVTTALLAATSNSDDSDDDEDEDFELYDDENIVVTTTTTTTAAAGNNRRSLGLGDGASGSGSGPPSSTTTTTTSIRLTRNNDESII